MRDSSEGTAYPRAGLRRAEAHVGALAPRNALCAAQRPTGPPLPGLPDNQQAVVLAAVPSGYRLHRSMPHWLAHCERQLRQTGWREDRITSRLAVCRQIAAHRSRTRGSAWPGWPRIQAAACLSRATVARCLADLRALGLTAHVRQGSTPQFRKGTDDDGCLAGEYAPIIKTETPPVPTEKESRLIARESTHPQAALRAAGIKGREPQWPANQATRTKRQRLAAAETLRLLSPAAYQASARNVRSIARPWLAAGWTVRDLIFAIDHTPAGAEHPYAYNARDLRSPAGWIVARLRLWRDKAGAPLPSPRQQAETANRAARAEHERWRGEVAHSRSTGGARMPDSLRAMLRRHPGSSNATTHAC